MDAKHTVEAGSQTTITSCAISDLSTSVLSNSCASPACIQEHGLRIAAEQLNSLLQEDNKLLANQLLQEQIARMDLENRLMESTSEAKYDQRMHIEYKTNAEDLQRNLETMQLKVLQLEFEVSEALCKQSYAGDLIDFKLSESRAIELEARQQETESEVDFYKSQIEEFKMKMSEMSREKAEMISFEDHLRMMKSSEDFFNKCLNKEFEVKDAPSILTSASSAALPAINTPDLPDISLLLPAHATLCFKGYVIPNDVQPLSHGSWSSDEDMEGTEAQERLSGAVVDSVQAAKDAKPRIAPKPKHLLKKDNVVVEDFVGITHFNDLSLVSSTEEIMEEEPVSFSQEIHSPPLKVPSRPKGPQRRNPKSSLLRKGDST